MNFKSNRRLDWAQFDVQYFISLSRGVVVQCLLTTFWIIYFCPLIGTYCSSRPEEVFRCTGPWCLSKWGIKSWFKSSRQCRPPKLWFSLFSSKKILSCQTAKLQCKTLDTPTKLNFLKEYVPREGRKEMTIDSRDFRSSKKRTTKVFFWITWGGWNSKKIYFD